MRRFVDGVGEEYDEEDEDDQGEEDHFQEVHVRPLGGDVWEVWILAFLVVDLDVASWRG